jgi:hypothetical protein
MDAQRIDPRGIIWEVDDPIYRVYFWRDTDNASEEWRLTEAASFRDVQAWADAQVQTGWTYQVFAEVTTEQGLGTLRLFGTDPTAPDGAAR